MKVIFMGTPGFAVPPLAIIAENHEVAMVVTTPDKPRNRGKSVTPSPVKEKALELGLKVATPEKIRGNDEFIAEMKAIAPDVIVVAAYGKILPKEVLDIPEKGCLNIHASLLPRHRGAAPIQNAVLLGDEETGVTIMRMADGIDTGDMILKASVPIERKTAGELHDELSAMGANLIYNVLEFFEEGLSFPEKHQNELKATYAPMIKKSDGELNFAIPALKAERRIRAMDPWPGAYTYYKDKVMKVWWADVIDEDTEFEPGYIIKADKNGMQVACLQGILNIRTIQMPGKRRVSVGEYLKGNEIEEGTVLGKDR